MRQQANELSASPISGIKDKLAAAPLIVWCLFGIWGFIIEIAKEWSAVDIPILQMAAQILGAVYLSQMAVLLVLRRLPLLRNVGVAPQGFVLLAANSALLLLLLPTQPISAVLSAVSATLLLMGTIGSIFALYSLGRAFSIFPQARLFASAGSYRLSRHPLYLRESISTFGLALQFLQPWAFVVALISLLLQFPRMRLEETVMARAFPEYLEYAEHTPRFVPFAGRWGFNR